MTNPKPMSPERTNQIKAIQQRHGWFIVDTAKYIMTIRDEAQAKDGLELAAQLPQDYDELMAVLAACGFTFKRFDGAFTQYWTRHETGGSRALGGTYAWCDPWLPPAAILFAYLYDDDPFPGFNR